jgi:hypothetical protein
VLPTFGHSVAGLPARHDRATLDGSWRQPVADRRVEVLLDTRAGLGAERGDGQVEQRAWSVQTAREDAGGDEQPAAVGLGFLAVEPVDSQQGAEPLESARPLAIETLSDGFTAGELQPVVALCTRQALVEPGERRRHRLVMTPGQRAPVPAGRRTRAAGRRAARGGGRGESAIGLFFRVSEVCLPAGARAEPSWSESRLRLVSDFVSPPG